MLHASPPPPRPTPRRPRAQALTLGLSRRTWLLFNAGYALALLLKAARKELRRRRDAFEGLDGIVSFSSRMIAGGRAGDGGG